MNDNHYIVKSGILNSKLLSVKLSDVRSYKTASGTGAKARLNSVDHFVISQYE
jgi:hypothetical protein